MDLGTVRTLNVVGTVLFGIMTMLAPVAGFFWIGMVFFWSPDTSYLILCLTGILAWIIIFGFLTYKLYQNTVVSLDKRNYTLAKQWTLYGVIMGAVLGFLFTPAFLILIVFLLAYMGIEGELRPKYWGYPPYPYYPPPPPAYPYGPPPAHPPYPQQQQYPPTIGIKGQPPAQAGYKIKQQQPVSRSQAPRAQPRTPAQQPVKYAVKERRKGKSGDKD